MGERPYRRELTQLSRLLIATIVLGTLAALVWLVGVTLSVGFDVDVDLLSPVLGALMVATVICAGLELTRNDSKWVRAVGVVVVVAAVIAVVVVLLVLWYVALLCRNGCN